MFTQQHIDSFSRRETPFYFYDTKLLAKTLTALKSASKGYHVHYALKANAHPTLLNMIRNEQFGADCVSGNEIKRAIECGFKNSEIAFAGVGKSDKEIEYALHQNIFCFNAES